MNKFVISKALLVGSAGVLLAMSAQAEFNPARGNIVFGAVEVGASSGFDFVVDLGANNAFQAYTGVAAPNSNARLLGGLNASEAYQGQVYSSENRFTVGTITASFGNLDNVLFSSFGIDSEAGAANSTFFMTRTRTDVNVQSTPWARASSFSQGGTGNNLEAPRINAIANGTDFSDTFTREASSDGSGYNAKIPVAGYTDMEGNTGAGFTGGAIARSDFYYVAHGTGASDYLGYFEWQADGDLWFIPENFVPVPETSTYGIIAGAGLLLLALRRKLGQSQTA